MTDDLRDDPAPVDEWVDEEDEYEEIGPPPRHARRVVLFLLAVLLGIVVMVGVGALWVMRQVDPPGPPGERILVEIPEGSSTGSIGSLLVDDGVIANSTVWRYYVRWKDAGPFQAGQFEFRANSSMGDAVGVLDGGPLPPDFALVTIPEGLTVGEILESVAGDVERFSTESLLAALGSGQVDSRFRSAEQTSWEGLLFPETYALEDDENEVVFLNRMSEQLSEVADQLGVGDAATRFDVTPYQVLVVASLIEEEARIDEDRPKVARVIYNRLASGEPLGIDATLCYVTGGDPCRLTRSDLAIDSPYNSRRTVGLTPTPIATFGRAALEAAIAPADGDWFYYVLDPSAETPGGHFFTPSAAEFERKKAECRDAGLGCG